MAYEKQTWVPYDDNKTEEENIQNGAVVTAERMNYLETGLDEHDKNTTNPHKVTKAQVGLGNVTNVEQAPKTDFTFHTSNKTNPHGVTKGQVGLGNVTNVEQASKTEYDSHVADKTNPHSVTKAQVGLGNVDNYATANQTDAEQGLAGNKFITPMGVKRHVDSRMATQAEAEAGTATNKFMTPALVFKAIAKWVQGKFVSTTGNETILGTKNFQDGLQVKGNLPVLTKSVNDFASVDKNNNASVISNGSMRLSRRGDIVYLTGSFQLSAAKNNQAVWSDVPAWAAPIDMPRMYWSSGGNFYLLTFDPSTINNIICTGNVAKDAWLTGSFCWLARDPY